MLLTQRDLTLAGLGAAGLTAIALAVANFAGGGDNGGGAEYLVTLCGSLVVAAALFGWGIPRSERPARLGLAVGLLGVLSLAAFWTGLPYVLGPAAVVLGVRGRARGARTEGATATVIGALVAAAAVVAVGVDL